MKPFSGGVSSGPKFAAIALVSIVSGAGKTLHSAATLIVPSQFHTIQAAVDAATAGDTIVIADGTYKGTGNHDVDFKGKGLTIKSSGGAANCVIDCERKGRAFYLHSNEQPASRIQGITITNGSVSSYGGGLYVDPHVECTAVDCIFRRNSGFEGGGGMYYGKAVGCTFANNSSLLNKFAGAPLGHGGGSLHTAAVNCTFSGNSAFNGGGGLAYGTAMGCTFTGNLSTKSGGGAFDCTSINCTFTGNRANGGGGIAQGGAVNCVFTGNQAESSGGAVYDATLIYCTVSGNSAVRAYGGGVYVDIGAPQTLGNCIIWGNKSGAGDPNVKNVGGTLTVAYCDIEGGFAGKGNIAENPLFADVEKGDFHLKPGSPCIDAGTATKVPDTDRDGAKRIMGPAPDMGAFESKP